MPESELIKIIGDYDGKYEYTVMLLFVIFHDCRACCEIGNEGATELRNIYLLLPSFKRCGYRLPLLHCSVLRKCE